MDETVLLEKAHALAARERLTRAVRAAASALLPGAVVAAGLTLVLKALGQPAFEGLAALALLPAGAALKQWLRPTDPRKAAYAADRALHLHERLGTATEWLLNDRPRTLMAQVMLRDAAAYAQDVKPEQAFPWDLPTGSLKRGLLLATLVVALALAPSLQPWWLRPDAEAVAVARQQAEELHQSARNLPETAELQDLKARVDDLQTELQRPDLDPRDALERIAALSEELRRLQQGGAGQGLPGEQGTGRAAQAEAARQLREAARALQKGNQAEARAALERLQSDPNTPDAAREAAKGALEALDRKDVDGAQQQCEGGAARAGQGQQAQGQGSGQGQQAQGNEGQRTTRSGEEPGEGDFGRGTTMENQPSAPKQHDFVMDRQSERQAKEWDEEYRRLHPPERSDVGTADARAGGTPGAGRTLPMEGEGLGAPSLQDQPAGRQAGDAYVQARQSAENAVARDEIPAGRRDLVRSYFEGIDPRR